MQDNGVLFFQDRADATAALFTGNANSILQGIFYFPDTRLTFGGNGSTQLYLNLVAKSVSFSSGTTTINNYAAINLLATPFITAWLLWWNET